MPDTRVIGSRTPVSFRSERRQMGKHRSRLWATAAGEGDGGQAGRGHGERAGPRASVRGRNAPGASDRPAQTNPTPTF